MKRLISEQWIFKLKSGKDFTEFYISLEGDRCVWSKGDTFDEAMETFKLTWKIQDFQVIEYDKENNVWKDSYTHIPVSKAIL